MINVSLPAVWGLSAQSRRRGVACQRYDATLADRDCTAAWQFASTRSSITILLGTNTDRPPRPHLPHHFALACGPTSRRHLSLTADVAHDGDLEDGAFFLQLQATAHLRACRDAVECACAALIIGQAGRRKRPRRRVLRWTRWLLRSEKPPVRCRDARSERKGYRESCGKPKAAVLKAVAIFPTLITWLTPRCVGTRPSRVCWATEHTRAALGHDNATCLLTLACR